MLHKNDRQNANKHAKMARRLKRGILEKGAKNSGDESGSKIHPRCKWYRRIKRMNRSKQA